MNNAAVLARLPAAEPFTSNRVSTDYPTAVAEAKPWLASATYTLRRLSTQDPESAALACAFRDALVALRRLNAAGARAELPGWKECPDCLGMSQPAFPCCVFCGCKEVTL